MALFLSDTWFEKVDEIRAELGDVPVPEALAAIVINVVITEHPDGDKDLKMAGGNFARGHADDAGAKLTLPYSVAKEMFVDRNKEAGMQAFMSGQMQVEGDMSLLMQMQSAGPVSDEQKELGRRISAVTEA
jgi:hypothetical protein